MKIAELGVQPALSLSIKRAPNRFAHGRFLLITRTPIRKFRSEDPPIKSYEGASGTVKVWRAKDPEKFLSPVFLHFRIGAWNILVGDGNVGTYMGRGNRRLWAENLAGRQTDNGYIVIEPRAPLAVGAKKGGGPDLLFFECSRNIELRLERCKDPREFGEKVQVVRGVGVNRGKIGRQFDANWCSPSGHVSVYLDDRNERFVDLAVRSLRIRNVQVRETPKSVD
jgi:hypothetical protein